jgi:hypothetical protein
MSEAFRDRRWGGYRHAAIEAPREYGILCGAYIGAWENYQTLQHLALTLHRQCVPDVQPAPDPPYDTETIARQIVEWNTRSTRLIAEIKTLFT